MSKLDGDKSRFQINRKRKMLLRQRRQLALAAILNAAGKTAPGAPAATTATAAAAKPAPKKAKKASATATA